jgi:hypothetical protein
MVCRCKGTGWVMAIKRVSGAVYSFRCGCDVSDRRNLSKSLPAWTETMSEEFELEGYPHRPIEKPVHECPPPPQAPIPPKIDYKMLSADPHYYDDLDDLPF